MSNHNNQKFLNQITSLIETNLQNEQFGVSRLAGEMNMSRSNLHRKIKSETGKSVSQFIMQVRLRYARNMLSNENLSISEIAYNSGFHSVSYFNKCFHDFFGTFSGGNEKISLKQRNGTLKDSIPKSKKLMVGSLMFVVLLVILLITYEIISIAGRYSHSTERNKNSFWSLINPDKKSVIGENLKLKAATRG